MTSDPQPSAPIETADLRLLDARALRFQRHGARLRMTIADQCCYLEVTIILAFPLSNAQRYLSVYDAQNKEIGMIVDARQLDAQSRALIEEDIERRYIVPVLQRVLAVKERFGTVDWTVATDRGLRHFTTRNMRENVVQPAAGRYLITDVDGSRYDVRDIAALDAASQNWLLRHM